MRHSSGCTDKQMALRLTNIASVFLWMIASVRFWTSALHKMKRIKFVEYVRHFEELESILFQQLCE